MHVQAAYAASPGSATAYRRRRSYYEMIWA